jgi:Raf kinase inhibitor-like YbhB/YbcL family protein
MKSVTTGMPVLLTGGQPGYRAGNDKLAWSRPDLSAADTVSVRSDAFENGSNIPRKYSAEEQNISPPLSWSNVPEGAMSLALIVEDPDAPTPNPFVHWLLYNIPADLRALPEDVGHEEVAAKAGGAYQGKNSSLKIGWTGMAPPKGDVPHHYHFQLFALDRQLPLKPGAGRAALLEAMAGHVVARGEIVGTFQR